jgi:hypothetical protein
MEIKFEDGKSGNKLSISKSNFDVKFQIYDDEIGMVFYLDETEIDRLYEALKFIIKEGADNVS